MPTSPLRPRAGALVSVLAAALSACGTTGAARPTAAPYAAAHLLLGARARGTAERLSREPGLRLHLEPLEARLAQLAAGAPDDEAARRRALGNARSELDAARTAYRELRFDAALSQLGRARAAVTPVAREKADFELLAALALQRGLCLLALKREADAAREIEWAQRLRGSAYPAGELSPEVERFVARTRAALDAEAPGTSSIDSKPSGARVFIDGQARGTTPLTVQLSPGLHHLRVVHGERRAKGALQRIGSGKIDRIALYLEPLSPAARARALQQTLARRGTIRAQALSALLGASAAGRWLLTQTSAGQATLARLASTGERPASFSCTGRDESTLARCLALALRGALAPSSPAPPVRTRSLPLVRRWWFWALVGAATAGAITGLAVGLHRPRTDLSIVSKQ